MTSLSRRAPCSLIRRTFWSPVVTPNLCHMQWHGASRSALHLDEARSQWRAHFSSSTSDSVFSDDFFHFLSVRFASLSSLHESGRFDAPFSYNELVAALSKCHESASGAASLTHSPKSHCHGGVIFSSPVSTLSCASLSFRQLGSPTWLFRSSSTTVNSPLLTPIVPFLSPPAPLKFSST